MRKVKIIACIIAGVLSLLSIYLYPQNKINNPNKIIIFNKGNQVVIEDDDPLFNDIILIVNQNYKNSTNIMLTKSLMEETDEYGLKSNRIAIEFLYSNLQINKLLVEGKFKFITYSKILIPIDVENYSTEEIFIGTNNYKNIGLKTASLMDFNNIMNTNFINKECSN